MKIVLISGKAGSGKDTVAQMLERCLEMEPANVIIAHYADLVKYICRTFFGWDGEKDLDGRTLIQTIGTDVVRAKDPDFWVRFLFDMLRFFPDTWDYTLIPDLRFPNELTYLKERGYDVCHIRVERPGLRSALTEQQQMHSSETALDEVEPDIVIINDGTLNELERKVSEVSAEIAGYHQFSIENV